MCVLFKEKLQYFFIYLNFVCLDIQFIILKFMWSLTDNSVFIFCLNIEQFIKKRTEKQNKKIKENKILHNCLILYKFTCFTNIILEIKSRNKKKIK